MIDMEHRMTHVEDECKSHKRRIEELERRQDDQDALVSAVATMNVRVGVVEEKIGEVATDVKELNSKSGKKWENMTEQLFGLVLAAAVGFLLGQIGL
jgi:outer membrane murein-binding lipoprotein Lpp